MIQTAMATLPVQAAATQFAKQAKTSVIVRKTAARLLQRRPVVPTRSIMTATPMLTVMIQTALATRLAMIVQNSKNPVRKMQIAAATNVAAVYVDRF